MWTWRIHKKKVDERLMVAVQIYDEYRKFSVEHLPGIDLHLHMTGRDVHRWKSWVIRGFSLLAQPRLHVPGCIACAKVGPFLEGGRVEKGHLYALCYLFKNNHQKNGAQHVAR